MQDDTYFDLQRVVILEVSAPYGLKPWQFERYVSISLHGEEAVDPKEILDSVERANLAEPISYFIDDKRHYTEWGASGAGHELIVAVAAGASSGVATAMTTMLMEFLIKRLSDRDKSITLTEAVRLSRSVLREDCSVTGKLELVSSEVGEKQHTVTWCAAKLESIYTVMISKNGKVLQIERDQP